MNLKDSVAEIAIAAGLIKADTAVAAVAAVGDAPVATPELDNALLTINDLFNALVVLSPWSLTDGWILEIQGYVIAHWDVIGPIVAAGIAVGNSDALKAAFLTAIQAVAKARPGLAVIVRLVVIIANVRWSGVFSAAKPALMARGVKV